MLCHRRDDLARYPSAWDMVYWSRSGWKPPAPTDFSVSSRAGSAWVSTPPKTNCSTVVTGVKVFHGLGCDERGNEDHAAHGR
jgi:hypothetical protein